MLRNILKRNFATGPVLDKAELAGASVNPVVAKDGSYKANLV
jgi:hypothetical protein